MTDVGRCGLCGGTLAARSYRGVPAGQCTTCHAVVLQADEAVQLLGRPDMSTEDAPYPVELFEAVTEPVGPAPEAAPEQRWLLPVGLALGVAAGLLAIFLVVSRRAEPEATAAPVVETPEVFPVASLRTALSEAWAAVSEHPDVAAGKFRMILEVAPRDADASYGLGYSLLRLGSREEGQLYLCRARGGASEQTRQEIESLLTQEGLTCSP
jgi:hypothetical protein